MESVELVLFLHLLLHQPSPPVQRHCPQPPSNVRETSQPRLSLHIQGLEVFRADLIHSRRFTTKELSDHLSDFSLGNGQVFLAPRLCFLSGRHGGRTKEIFKIFLLPPDNIPSRNQQLATCTINSRWQSKVSFVPSNFSLSVRNTINILLKYI